ncbi:hypothetical protein SDC9_58611 [bioreactor metagenome]|uniref:Uncharacterized protein n=1 Tax=bioreactor metagenome TaxID=1076179 RepID=A0A644X861_9ZZZZ
MHELAVFLAVAVRVVVLADNRLDHARNVRIRRTFRQDHRLRHAVHEFGLDVFDRALQNRRDRARLVAVGHGDVVPVVAAIHPLAVFQPLPLLHVRAAEFPKQAVSLFAEDALFVRLFGCFHLFLLWEVPFTAL